MHALSPDQQALVKLWEAHMAYEFEVKDAAATIATMTEHPNVNHVPILTGGVGREQLYHFYKNYFIPQMPPDVQIVPITRTVGQNRIVDEFIFKCTHTVQMDWFLPGVPPTGKPFEAVTLVVIEFKDGKIAAERIHWDQASVLVQIGLLDPTHLPVCGVESARKVLDPALPSNMLMKRIIKDERL